MGIIFSREISDGLKTKKDPRPFPADLIKIKFLVR